MDILDKSGIYYIYFEQENNLYYIGCSLNIKKRIKDHISMMNTNTHHNYKIQNLYNKFGLPVFGVLEYCDPKDLFDKEVYYINEFDSFNNGLNLTVGGNGRLFGENNPNAKYTKEQYKKVIEYLTTTSYTYSKIMDLTGVSKYIIKQMAALTAHMYLEHEMPEEYTKLKALLGTRKNSAKDRGIVYPIVLSPNGNKFEVTNVNSFCKEHVLQPSNFHKVLIGKRRIHKGWTLA